MTRRALAVVLTAFAAAASSGCRDTADVRDRVHYAPSADGLATGYSTEGARHVRTIIGFQDPESVRYDADQDVFFVSNIAGFGSLKDGNGYINRVRAGSVSGVEVFVRSGANGVTLDAPKGMTIQGDTLWVTDIDVVRGFHRVSGASVGTIDFKPHGAVLLNDIAVGGDGTIRVTDTGIKMVYEGNIYVGGDRIFEIGPGRRVRVLTEGPELRQPNGIAWDSAGGRWLLVSFDRFAGDVSTIPAGPTASRSILRRGKGQLDGVEPLGDGGILFSSWSDSSIHVLRNGTDTRVIREVPEPADIGLDTRRNRVLIPLTVAGQVQVWSIESIADCGLRVADATTQRRNGGCR